MPTPTAGVLTRALNAHLSKSTRSEDLERYEEFFVAVVGADQLLDSGCQIIYGRGGTGKTLLIGAINERCRANAKSKHSASVSFSASSFDCSPDYGTEASPRERTHFYFQMFIDQLCTQVVELADELIERPNWFTSLSIFGERILERRERLLRLCVDLLDAAKFGVEISQPGDVASTQHTQQTAYREGSVGGRGQVNATLSSGLSASVQASLGTSRNQISVAAKEESVTPRRGYSGYQVRELISEIVDTLGLDHLVVFIDEWMTLYDCQVDFAERLKKSLLHERRIAVKIATDQYMTSFNNSGEGTNFRGIDVGRDAFVALDLDEPFSSSHDQEDFFAQALYRRLWVFNPELEEYFGRPPLSNPKRFVDAIFTNSNAFRHACRSSHGICRDFYEIVRQSFKRSGGDLASNKISHDHVRGALGFMTQVIYDRLNQSPMARATLYDLIMPHIRFSRSRYFVTATGRGELKSRLDNLLSKRVLHKVQPDAIHPTLRGQFEVWEINAGLFADLMHAVEFSTGERVDDSFRDGELALITEASLDTYLLSVDGHAMVGANEPVICRACSFEFSKSHKAFVMYGICPSCYMKQAVSEDGVGPQ